MYKALKFGLLATSLSFATLGVSVSTPVNAQVFYMKKNTDYEKATAAMKDGNLERASLLYSRALKGSLREDIKLNAYNNLCAVDFARGSLESAEKACSNAISSNRLFWRAYINRGHVRSALGKVDLALKDLRKAVKLQPDNLLAKRVLERYENQKGKLYAKAN